MWMDTRTDRHDEANIPFPQVCASAYYDPCSNLNLQFNGFVIIHSYLWCILNLIIPVRKHYYKHASKNIPLIGFCDTVHISGNNFCPAQTQTGAITYAGLPENQPRLMIHGCRLNLVNEGLRKRLMNWFTVYGMCFTHLSIRCTLNEAEGNNSFLLACIKLQQQKFTNIKNIKCVNQVMILEKNRNHTEGFWDPTALKWFYVNIQKYNII